MNTHSSIWQDRQLQRFAGSSLMTMALLVLVVLWLFPVAWMVLTAFKPNAEITRNELPLGIVNPTLQNFSYLFENTQFVQWLGNSILVSVITTIFSVVVGTLAAYGLVRFRLRGGGAMGLGIFVTYLLPQTLLFIPIAAVVRQLGVFNNLLALILVYPTMMVPFCAWLMMGYFRAIPIDLEESARVDGATRWTAFLQVTLPLAVPGIISAAIFTFTMSWSEYLYALVLVPSTDIQTIPVGVPNALSSGDVFIWGSLMAAALLGSLPIVLIYSLFMRYFISGMTAGAVKG